MLDSDSEYYADEGSTRITIKSQTLEEKTNKGDNNTIAIEYRNEDNEVKKTAQNFIVDTTPKTDPEVENVIKLINNIPSVSSLTLNDKGTVQNAKSAYDKLSDSKKGDVSNYNKLREAEAVIKQLENDKEAAEEAERREKADREAAQKVIDLINKIPDSISISDANTIHTARNGYDSLENRQQDYVSNSGKLFGAETTLSNIEGYIDAAKPVVDKIDKIPDNIKLEHKGIVSDARTAYDALTENQKKYVTNYETLLSAEDAISLIEKEISENSEAADPVIKKIDAIPNTVTLDSKDKVTDARNAYNLLTANQKAYVTNYKKLTKAEEEIARLEKNISELKAMDKTY